MTKAIKSFLAGIHAAIDTRAAYEATKNPSNENIQKTLAGIRADLDHEAMAKVMVAANVSAEFINAAERGNARFNVYAAEKVANVARALAGAGRLNHYTQAILASAHAVTAAGQPFTHADAVAACTLSIKANPDKPLVRYEKHVAPNTASTQASSSIAALKTFGMLLEGKTASGAVAYAPQNTDGEKILLGA
jgi:hypothetical protein